jgi:hypothetical protein
MKPDCTEIPVCYLCGSIDHNPIDCLGGICFNCFRPGHKLNQCPRSKRYRSDSCSSCHLIGHREETCPDQWRIYVWADENMDKKELAKGFENVYCYNCAAYGHLGDECSREKPAYVSKTMPNNTFSAFVSEDYLYNKGYDGCKFIHPSLRAKSVGWKRQQLEKGNIVHDGNPRHFGDNSKQYSFKDNSGYNFAKQRTQYRNFYPEMEWQYNKDNNNNNNNTWNYMSQKNDHNNINNFIPQIQTFLLPMVPNLHRESPNNSLKRKSSSINSFQNRNSGGTSSHSKGSYRGGYKKK